MPRKFFFKKYFLPQNFIFLCTSISFLPKKIIFQEKILPQEKKMFSPYQEYFS